MVLLSKAVLCRLQSNTITAVTSDMYNDICVLHQRCEFVLYFMAKRISSFQSDTSEMIDNEMRRIIE